MLPECVQASVGMIPLAVVTHLMTNDCRTYLVFTSWIQTGGYFCVDLMGKRSVESPTEIQVSARLQYIGTSMMLPV